MKKEEWKNIFGETPEGFHDSVNSALSKISEREETKMSRSFSIKKAVIAVAVVAAFGVTAVAAVKATFVESHLDLREAVTDIADFQEMCDDENLGVNYPDEFSNGYGFDKGYISDEKAGDSEGNTIREYKAFSADYENGKKSVTLFAEPAADIIEMPGDCETETVGGTTVYKIETTFKFVPPDYEMTEQDKADEASGKYVFSYGTDEVEIETMRQVMWVTDGNVVMTLLDGKDAMDMDELVSMAEEIINA